jgi:TIR domain-containing protein
MSNLFISHSSQDDGFVRELRQALEPYGQDGWIDSRELRGGDLLWPEIQRAIEGASAYAVVVSPASLQSKWVGKELRHALDVQKQRGNDKFRVFALSLDSTKLRVLEEFFDAEPLYIAVSSAAGGVEAAIHPILVALGKREPTDVETTPQPPAQPLEELVLELTNLKFHEQDGVRRASARAQLVYEPATPGQPHVHSAQSWLCRAYRTDRGEGTAVVSEKIRHLAESLFQGSCAQGRREPGEMGTTFARHGATRGAHSERRKRTRIDGHAGRRFSVHVDTTLEAGASDADVATAREAATLLLALPWELLHDSDGFLFQGAKPTRVRRRLPPQDIGKLDQRRHITVTTEELGPLLRDENGAHERSKHMTTSSWQRFFVVAAWIVIGAFQAVETFAAEDSTINFDDVTQGQLPTGWTIDATNSGGALAEWSVVTDSNAPSKPNVLTL